MLALSAPLTARTSASAASASGTRKAKSRRTACNAGGAYAARAKPLDRLAGSASRYSSTAATGPSRSNARSVSGWTMPNAASTVFGPSRSVPDCPGCHAAPASPITCRFSTGAPIAASKASASALASNASNGFALPSCQPRARFSPASTTPSVGCSPPAKYRRPISNSRTPAAPRFMLRSAAENRPGSSDGRMTFNSSLIGLASVQAPPPIALACASDRKLQVSVSLSPRAAAARRARLSRRCSGVAVGLATPAARGSGTGATESIPSMRMISSTRSAGPSTSRRAGGGNTVQSPSTVKPSAVRIARWRSSATARPPSVSASAGS